jgi:Uma2 family endonuclease
MLLKNDPTLYLPSAEDLPAPDNVHVDNQLEHLIPGLLEAILALIWSERLDWFFGVSMGIYSGSQMSEVHLTPASCLLPPASNQDLCTSAD